VSQPEGDRLEHLPAALALEVDALCDDFERHWRRSRRRGTAPPCPEAFAARAAAPARATLRRCLRELERDLIAGLVLPEVPGLTLEEEIGRGGMGVVYRARRADDGRAVALKLIPGAEHARWSRWLAELAGLHHPHLIPLEGFGSHDGLHFLVMPLVPGGDLKERLGEFVQRPRAAADLLAKVAGAVAFLHARGILHRDLKPSNILLAECSPPLRGGSSENRRPAAGYIPLVCDFGLAGRLDAAEAPRVVGTPSYMAPEQREGRALTPAADIWSLGAILHELLTGCPPFVGPPRLVDAALERICRRCLADEPAARYPAAEALTADLQAYLDANP
jgi:serine/threonine-protein kinase